MWLYPLICLGLVIFILIHDERGARKERAQTLTYLRLNRDRLIINAENSSMYGYLDRGIYRGAAVILTRLAREIQEGAHRK